MKEGYEMKKTYKFFILVVLSLLVIAGCSSNSTGESDSANETEPSNSSEANSSEANNSEETTSIDFPKESIELIIPYSAGGGTDIVGRALAKATEKHLDTDIIVQNITGGGGAVGLTEGANVKPDGYTVTMITNALSLLPHQGLADVSHEDYIPIAKINQDPTAIIVTKDSQFETMEDLLAFAEENPGELRTGNTGSGMKKDRGSGTIENVAGVEFNHVPFEGAAPTLKALLGGEIDLMTTTLGEAKGQIDAGEVRALALLSKKRDETYSDIPTFEEATGLEINELGPWRGIGVPKDTPEEVVSILSEAFMNGANDEEFVEFMKSNSFTLDVLNSEEFAEFLKEDYEFHKELLELIQ